MKKVKCNIDKVKIAYYNKAYVVRGVVVWE